MQTLLFKTQINTTASYIWQTMLQPNSYTVWTSIFSHGSYAECTWEQGSNFKFKSPKGTGVYGIVEKSVENEIISFKHLGRIENNLNNANQPKWAGALETYEIIPNPDGCLLKISMEVEPEMAPYFEAMFVKVTAFLKQIIEAKHITIATEIVAPIDKVWNYFTEPAHIVNWNFAAPTWHCPKAENDLKVDGNFSYTMAAKDNSHSFNFNGIYTKVEPEIFISYAIEGGRNVNVYFIDMGGYVKIIENFEPENENSFELQQAGWQAILDNFKQYVENSKA
jgi:uncharacterized protein YndB with AHSA1/START domain